MFITQLSSGCYPFCCHWRFDQLNTHISHKIVLLWCFIASFWFKRSSVLLCVCVWSDFLHVCVCSTPFDVSDCHRVGSLVQWVVLLTYKCNLLRSYFFFFVFLLCGWWVNNLQMKNPPQYNLSTDHKIKWQRTRAETSCDCRVAVTHLFQ